jgi:hypothetical protein
MLHYQAEIWNGARSAARLTPETWNEDGWNKHWPEVSPLLVAKFGQFSSEVRSVRPQFILTLRNFFRCHWTHS